jgi:hypothetical protein
MMPTPEFQLSFAGFALAECVIEVDASLTKYIRAVHRTALELATQNRFGAEIGGFWLLPEEIEQLRKLPECYSIAEAPLVSQAIEIYLEAQLGGLYKITQAKT